MPAPPKKNCQRLTVHVRQVLDEAGAAAESESVYCPSKGTIDLSVCRRCERLLSVAQDSEGRPAALECVPPPSAPTAPATTANPLLEARVLSSLLKVRVGEVMSREVLCVRPTMLLSSLTQVMVTRGFNAVPVVNEHNVLIGLVTKDELLKSAIAQSSDPMATVRQVMLVATLRVSEHDPVARAASLMAYENFSFVPVIDEAGGVVGMLAALDVLAFVARRDGYVIPSH